jgi:hypothetical protein
MQLDMMQHSYFIMQQCLREHTVKRQLYIEFRMGSVPNPLHDPNDKKSRRRITTTYGVVHISRPLGEASAKSVEWITALQTRVQARMQRRSKDSRYTIVQGPYVYGATLGRYQDVPPSFHTTSGCLTSDPIISLLNVYPTFPNEQMGRALDRLNDMLASNLILSMHIRDDWIREEGAHPPRLCIAFTITGPTITEAVRSMIQIELQEILQNPQAMVLLPSANPYPQPRNTIEWQCRQEQPKPSATTGRKQGRYCTTSTLA